MVRVGGRTVREPDFTVLRVGGRTALDGGFAARLGGRTVRVFGTRAVGLQVVLAPPRLTVDPVDPDRLAPDRTVPDRLVPDRIVPGRTVPLPPLFFRNREVGRVALVPFPPDARPAEGGVAVLPVAGLRCRVGLSGFRSTRRSGSVPGGVIKGVD